MESIIERKSYEFALMCIKAGKKIQKEKIDFFISQQLIKSSTSIGANIREANSGESIKDFVHKMTIALKEAAEANYWCCLLRDCEMLPKETGQSLVSKSHEVRLILGKIVSTTRAKIKVSQSGQK